MHRFQQGNSLVWRRGIGAVISFRDHDGWDDTLRLVGLKEIEDLARGAFLRHFADHIGIQKVSHSSSNGLTGRLSRGPAGTRPNRRSPSRKLPAGRDSSLITRNDAPSSCQSKVAPDLMLNRSRSGFGTTVWPLLVTVLVMAMESLADFCAKNKAELNRREGPIHQLDHPGGARGDLGVVRGHDQRRPPLLAQGAKQLDDPIARVRIQVAGRFIGQD